MPLYEYVCQDCKMLFSEVLTIQEHETKKVRCPKCQSREVANVMATAQTRVLQKSAVPAEEKKQR